MRIFTTDGSCSKNPGPGSYCSIEWEDRDGQLYIVYNKIESYNNTTNNRMELMAILDVFKLMAETDSQTKFIIYSDSAYCINMLKPGGWIEGWSKNNWMNSKKQTVENLDIIKELYKYRNIILDNCQLEKVKGHEGDIKNEITDAIASKNKNKLRKFMLENHVLTDFKD